MSAIDHEVETGDPMPLIQSVAARDGFKIGVTWNRAPDAEIDLAPDIFTFKIYAALRNDRRLFETVRVVDNGAAIAWGDASGTQIEMPATAIERLGAEAMEEADLRVLMRTMQLTRDGLAAQLGISRRLVGYYLEGQVIPRYIALACAGLKARSGMTATSR